MVAVDLLAEHYQPILAVIALVALPAAVAPEHLERALGLKNLHSRFLPSLRVFADFHYAEIVPDDSLQITRIFLI
jgi:hypothetical protein